jgi:hypothetical protein
MRATDGGGTRHATDEGGKIHGRERWERFADRPPRICGSDLLFQDPQLAGGIGRDAVSGAAGDSVSDTAAFSQSSD